MLQSIENIFLYHATALVSRLKTMRVHPWWRSNQTSSNIWKMESLYKESEWHWTFFSLNECLFYLFNMSYLSFLFWKHFKISDWLAMVILVLSESSHCLYNFHITMNAFIIKSTMRFFVIQIVTQPQRFWTRSLLRIFFMKCSKWFAGLTVPQTALNKHIYLTIPM